MTDDRVRRWLEAEWAGQDREAESLFSALFAEAVPVLDPPPGFAERVTASALAAWAARPWAWRSVRLSGAAAMILMGVIVSFLTALDPFTVLQVSAGAGAGLLADARAVLHGCLAAGLTAWALASSVGRALLLASSSGLAPFVLGANLLLALVSSCGLARLMAPREELS